MNRRALHYVFKVGDRKKTIHFFKDVLGMKILRHEEFTEGCKAQCNGPYDGKWSKTMVGYGPEDDHFVMELTYNYGVGSYKMGNDFQCISIDCKTAYERIKNGLWPSSFLSSDSFQVESPGGYHFIIHNRESSGDPVKMIALSVTNIKRSIEYWSEWCGLEVVSSCSSEAVLQFSPEQCQVKLISIQQPVDHASAFGRIAFSCPRSQLIDLENLMTNKKQKILKHLDDHEICFVGDEAFRELSRVDPKADKILADAIQADKSDEWFNERRGGKTQQ
ncbi:Glyoxalase domain-containing protein 4 [Fasciola hepatica]|uniref:Glyoxalase domain-containing protein 4 n=1 Tax=Fasciola hepatica TaxID=6192 RepID=A0A4E0RRS8_FASHE|nr:Glyoxalase domain-containing protein 4 [Fasciola hepatica]